MIKKIIGYDETTGEPIFEQETPVNEVNIPTNTINTNRVIVGYNPNTGEPIYNDVMMGQIPPKKSRKGLIITIIILVLLAVGGLTTWLIISNSGNSDEPDTEEKNNKKDNNKNNGKQNGSEWESYHEYSEEELKDADYEGNITNRSNIDTTVLVDKNDIRIIAKRIRYRYNDASIMIVVENNSKNDIIVNVENFSVNDIMVDAFVFTDVAAGKKALTSIRMDDRYLVEADITTIGSMEFDIEIKKNNYSYDSWFTVEDIKLKTDADDFEQEYAGKKELLMDKNNVKIYSNGVNNELDDVWGRRMLFYIENNNDFAIRLRLDSCKINGTDIGYGGSMYTIIQPHKKSYGYAYVSTNIIDKYNIDSIKTANVVFGIYKGKELLDEYFKSDVIDLDYEK
ncbi:MAG: hypothetical protein IKN87_00095 [Bacilli bacterium]|nr:hypothetical protein [Bacilli bacterium]